jgi:hypothetical protein
VARILGELRNSATDNYTALRDGGRRHSPGERKTAPWVIRGAVAQIFSKPNHTTRRDRRLSRFWGYSDRLGLRKISLVRRPRTQRKPDCRPPTLRTGSEARELRGSFTHCDRDRYGGRCRNPRVRFVILGDSWRSSGEWQEAAVHRQLPISTFRDASPGALPAVVRQTTD